MRIVEDMEKKIATIKSAIRKNEDTLYRDYDPATLSAIKECKDSESKIRDIEELLKNLHSQLAKTDSQLKFQSGRAVSMKLRDEEIRRIFANDEKKLEIAREEINTINKLIGASSMELNDIKQSLDAAELSVSEYDRACRGIERDMRDLNGRSEHLTRTLFSVEHELERIYMEKSSILLKAQAEQIDIPIVNGLLKDIPRSQIEISYSLGDSSIEYSNTNESVKAPSNKFMAPSLEKIPIDFPKLSEIEILVNTVVCLFGLANVNTNILTANVQTFFL